MNLVSIENDHFSASIDLKGAQLASLFHKGRREEVIWQRDPSFWAESAPVCFPIVGGLKGGSYQYDGRTYSMQKHGVVRYADFQLKAIQEDVCTLEVKADEQTLEAYPFHFVLEIRFQLTDRGIRVEHLIRNEDRKTMPASLGYHPAFNIDIERFEHNDYYIEFSEAENLDLYWLDGGLLALKEEHYLQDERIIPLSQHIFDDDALIFKNIASNELMLRRQGSDWKIVVSTGGAPHLGIWAKPAAPYVCIEPWYTYNDSMDASGDLFEKPGMFSLVPGGEFASYYEISL